MIHHEFDDVGTHLLEIELSNKTLAHTQINSAGNIISDVRIIVDGIKFLGVNINELVWRRMEYHHDFNGTRAQITDSFHGEMGCNGIVRLSFDSPTYIWLLENCDQD